MKRVKFETISGFCPKLNKKCSVISEYEEVLMCKRLTPGYKFMNSKNLETGISCYRDGTTTFYNCELFKECEIDRIARSLQR